MKKTFTRKIQIRFHEADPAGILYFANILSLAHDTFEDFIQAAGLPWAEWFTKNPYFIPIRHAEADYFAPFMPGEFYEIHTVVDKLSESSFGMRYEFTSSHEGKQKSHAIVKMVHTFADPKTKTKTAMPEKIRTLLSPYLQTEKSL